MLERTSSSIPFGGEKMSVPVVAWCPGCNAFIRAYLPITGEGATLVVKGEVHVTCPKCRQKASAPGGEFKVDREQMTRLSSKLTKQQADNLQGRLTKWRDAGMHPEVLQDIVENYAPELRGLVDFARKQPGSQTRVYLALLFVILMLLVKSCKLNVNVNLDINQLLDQICDEANEEVQRLPPDETT